MPEHHVTDVARVIQLAVAPVFLLTSIGTILSVLSGRLARIVDRARALVERTAAASAEQRNAYREEVDILLRRRRLVHLAITSGTTAALLVCAVIATAFIGYLMGVDFSVFLAVLFIGAMAAIVLALVFFLREVLLALTLLRIEIR